MTRSEMARTEPQEPAERAADEASDAAEPTHSEPRMKRPSDSGALRPVPASAFGPPRRSAPPPAPASAEARPTSQAASYAGEPQAPVPAQAGMLNASAPPSAAPAVRSLEATPDSVAPAPLAEASAVGPGRRRIRRSVALFAGMLALSAVPLTRMLQEARSGSPERPASAVRQPAQTDELLAQAEAESARAASQQPQEASREETIAAWLSEAQRALDADDVPTAERLYGRIIELDESNPRAAYGLARVRLAQGNLTGAEGWIQQAIRRRPRRASYHALYADILERMGHSEAAREEREQASKP